MVEKFGMFAVLLFFLLLGIVKADRFVLDGSDWKFRSNSANVSYSGNANVPGDIYTDLFKNSIINNPLYGNGDQDYKWVGRTDWVYEKIFSLPANVMSSNEVVLVFESLDTFATGYLNGQQIFYSQNLWLPLSVNIKSNVVSGTNNLTLVFTSTVSLANVIWKNYTARTGHDLPTDCTTSVGECHANFIRKTQSSYSWDWGPSFPTMGIAGASYIAYFNDASIYRVSPLITKNPSDNFFKLQVDTLVFCHSGSSVTVNLNLTEINLSATQTFSNVNCVPGQPTNLSQTFNVPDASIQRWWPNGYGNQTLYTLNTQLVVNNNPVDQNSLSVGFRTIDLIQDQVDPTNANVGLTFYFKVNDVPIFLKGSNFIPIDPFPAQNFTLRKQFLFKSMQLANLNALRIWGGGLFETDEFYSMADQHGIMFWHDQMFACSEYPAETDFLNLVQAEISSQVTRLRYHPSILAWAGNNEDEWGVRSWWNGVKNYNVSQQIADYITLTVKLIKPTIENLDPSRPFILSSPTNGKKSEADGGVSSEPGSEHWGDTHYYNYNANLWKDKTFPIPRCATEFGAQSLPLTGTMAHWVNASEWSYGSYWLESRQHHPNGNPQNLELTFLHFETPYECSNYTHDIYNCPYVKNTTEFINDFAYLTQVLQAVAMQTESEHYRRYRSVLTTDGRGGTMCALYWQLNDVWAAPTWASIDYDLNWKVLHYYAKRFFAPVIVSPFIDGNNQLQVSVVSDLQTPLNNHNLILDVFSWQNGFTPIYTTTKTVNVPGLNSTSVDIQTELTANNITLDNNDGFVIRAVLYDPSINPVTPMAILLPDQLRQISNPYYGDATIANVQAIIGCSRDDCYPTYEITLTATKIVPILWLDIKPEIKYQYQLMYWFTDNGFTMTQPKIVVELKIFSSTGSVSLTAADFTVSRIKMASNQPPTGGPIINKCPVDWYTSTVNAKSCLNAPSGTQTWDASSYVCNDLAAGASLISIDNAFANSDATSFVQKYASSCSQAFIGLHKTSDWVWVNGDNSTYRNWASGYPTNDANSLCAVISKSDGTWTNTNCNTPSCYVCQLNF